MARVKGFDESCNTNISDWELLNNTWFDFIQKLGDRWWGDVSLEAITTYMNRPDIEIGAVIVSGYEHRDGDVIPGILCCITVKTPNNTVARSLVYIHNGVFVSTFSRRSYTKLWSVICNALNKPYVGKGHLVRRPPTLPYVEQLYYVTSVIYQMRDFIRSMQELWWGSSRHRDRALSDIKRCQDQHSAGLVCITQQSEIGYLFDVVTQQARCYIVTFNKPGFILKTLDHNGSVCATSCFRSITGVLAHMKTSMHLTFVPRPCPVLQDLCRDIVNQHAMPVPPGLRYVTTPGL